MTEQELKIKSCPNQQTIAGLSVCLEMQAACKKIILCGKCPLGYCFPQSKSNENK